MAAGPFTVTDAGQANWAKGDLDLDSPPNAIVCVLVDNIHTPNAGTEATYADISADEVSDITYPDYAPEVITVTVTDIGGGIVEMDSTATVNFGDAVDIAARYMYVVQRAAASLQASDLIWGYMDLNDGGSDNAVSIGSDFKVSFNATNGMCRVSKTP